MDLPRNGPYQGGCDVPEPGAHKEYCRPAPFSPQHSSGYQPLTQAWGHSVPNPNKGSRA